MEGEEGGEKKGVKAERGDQAGGDHDSRRSRHAGGGWLSNLSHVFVSIFHLP